MHVQTYPRVHENKVHLHESEDHLKNGIDPSKNHVTRRSERHFEKRSELESVINHRAQTEGWNQQMGLKIATVPCSPLTDGTDSKKETTMTVIILSGFPLFLAFWNSSSLDVGVVCRRSWSWKSGRLWCCGWWNRYGRSGLFLRYNRGVRLCTDFGHRHRHCSPTCVNHPFGVAPVCALPPQNQIK